MQGDCLSAILFIYYLARCLDELKKEDDIQPDVFYIAPKYADDITFVTTSKEITNKIKETIPPQLKKYNLMVNKTKTEQYQIPRPHPDPLRLDLTSALDQSYLDRSKSVVEAINRAVDDLNDHPTGHVSTVPQDNVDEDNTPFTVHRKRRNNYNAVLGRKKNDKFKRGLE